MQSAFLPMALLLVHRPYPYQGLQDQAEFQNKRKRSTDPKRVKIIKEVKGLKWAKKITIPEVGMCILAIKYEAVPAHRITLF